MRFCILILILSCLRISASAQGQADVDSLLSEGRALRYSKPKQAIQLLKKANRNSQQSGYIYGQIKALQYQANAFSALGNRDSCIFYVELSSELAKEAKDFRQLGFNHGILAAQWMDVGLQQKAIQEYHYALTSFSEGKDTTNMALTHSDLSWVYGQMDELDSAMYHSSQFLTLNESIRDSAMIGFGFSQIATILKRMGEYDKARNLYERSIQLLNIHAPNDIAPVYNNLGILYKRLGEYGEALKYYDLAEKQGQSQKNIPLMTSLCINKGIALNLLERYGEAELELRKGLDFSRELNDLINLADAHNHLGRSLMHQNKKGEALPIILQAIDYASQAESKEKSMEAHQTAKDYYASVGNFYLAMFHMEKQQAIKDSIFQIEKAKQIHELQTRYEADKKDAEISSLKKAAEIKKARNQLLFGGLILISILAVSVFYGLYQKRQKEKILLQKEKELEVAKRQHMEQALEIKKKELTARILQLAAKNEFLDELQNTLRVDAPQSSQPQQLLRKIEQEKTTNDTWEQFLKEFSGFHQEFMHRLTQTHGQFSKSELRLIALLKMNLSSKDIANTLNISYEGVKKARQRLRRKLDLNPEQNLQEYLIHF